MHHRYGMIMFIASEVMFFVAWFWAFFDASLFSGEAIQEARVTPETLQAQYEVAPAADDDAAAQPVRTGKDLILERSLSSK